MVTLVLILWFTNAPPATVRLAYPTFAACHADLVDALKVEYVTGYCDDSTILAESHPDKKDHTKAPKTN